MLKYIIILLACLICKHGITQIVEKDSNSMKPILVEKLKENNFKPTFSIYPNPVKNKVVLQVKNFIAGLVFVKMLDLKGKMIREDHRLLSNGSEDIIMFLMLQPGIYFIELSQPGKAIRKKIVLL